MDYEFVLTGLMPLLEHNDDVMAADDLMAWRKDPGNKNLSVPGDDRSPPWTWTTYVYHNPADGNLAIPQANVMAALRYAGARVSKKGQSNWKAETQSGLLIGSDFCEFLSNGKPVPYEPIAELRYGDYPFAHHVATAKKMGFDLSVKRAPVGSSKHVRVRPIFNNWSVRGTIATSDPAITPDLLATFFEIAGRRAGLGDWRPSSKKSPGPYGMFAASLKPTRAARKTG